MSDVRFLVKRYIEEGFGRPHPIPRGEKGPRITGWNNPETTFDLDAFGESDNVGTALTKDLIDIDLDQMEAVKAAHRFLPTTGRIHGRPTKLSSHYWFRAEGLKAEGFKDVLRVDTSDPEGKRRTAAMLCEIRTGASQQTVLPPSTWRPKPEQIASGQYAADHEETLQWEHDRDPATVDGKTLRRAVLFTAIVALIVRSWPSHGRHQALLDLAGLLCRHKIDAKEAIEILSEITLQAEGEVWKDCDSAVRSTYAKTTAEGAKTTGGPSLEKAFGKDVVERLREWFGAGRSAEEKFEGIVEEMNAQHFYITVGSDTVVGTLKHDGSVKFQSEKAMYSWYANQRVAVGSRQIQRGPRKGESETEYRTKFEIWREHPKRRQFRALVFSPPPVAAAPEDFNLWTGLALQPKAGDCSLFLQHLRDNICRSVEEHYQYLLDWCALVVQQPGTPGDVAIVLKGKQGTGKGIFARNFGRVFGRHYMHLDKVDHLTGHFNAHLSGKVLIFADEAFFAGDRREIGTLKRLITEPTLTITPKRIDSYEEPNFAHVIMATNDEWAAPVDFGERRFMILNVGEDRMQDLDYFTAIQKQMDEGGREAFLALLAERVVSRSRVRTPPKTEEFRVQQEISMHPEDKWWFECLCDGYLQASHEEDAPDWPAWVDGHLAHEQYLAWCDQQKINRRLTIHELSKRVLSHYYTGPSERSRVASGGRRPRLYPLMPLKQARAAFDKIAGSKGKWDDLPPAPAAPRGPKGGGSIPEPRLPLADVPVEEDHGRPTRLEGFEHGETSGVEGGADTAKRPERLVGREAGGSEDEPLPF